MTHDFFRPIALTDIIDCWVALQRYASDPAKITRNFDRATPIAMHSILAASVLSAESDVPARQRWLGQQVLLRHDVIEDTTAGLAIGAPQELVTLVEGMTFPGGSKQERVEVWSRPPVVWWLKLYDKWANLADGALPGGWMESRGAEYRRDYIRFAHDLLDAVEARKAEIFPERPNVQLLVSGMIRGCFPVV